MLTNRIKLTDLTDIKEFVTLASKIDGNVIIQRGAFSVDGKSLMGIISIDTSSYVDVIYPENNPAFTQFIKQFEV